MQPNLPNEILSHIISRIPTDNEYHRLHTASLRHLAQVRLVCRLWNEIATKHMFHTVTLFHSTERIFEDFGYWQELIDVVSVRKAARRVAIESGQEYDGGGISYEDWPVSWVEHGKWPGFESAINRICDLPNLEAIEVRFTESCVGRNANGEPAAPNSQYNVEPETATTRFHTLRSVVRATKERASRPNTTVIRELVLENLQNMALTKDIAHDPFHNIQRLHIKILSENYANMWSRERRPDLIHREELREFPHYLQNTLLPSVADQLVELTISGKHWGGIPGEFNGNGLSFPKLKALTLDGLDILRQDQFDWVLEQKSLTILHLHNCTIATHCLVQQPEFAL
ncbi:f-box protein [Fusarium langsethiae]|uniref:F-box protein n=1 Tax=Fusarium langsethiae TaxID=179993 RepID=A0A0M9ETT3_FUSLA|nr:f-box protein [Fusarium langsethiae]GKU05065.1 unnamed protein product [Fusarium langsethiae]GKU22221.1 unnamed protein product [Fusarium langsethiae]